jgi:GrpB-like predicted nucleotidyltransferase (UPF0157 family)
MPFDPAYFIVDYDPNWPALYEAERQRLVDTLGAQLTRIEHVGSTSVPGLAAKPIIDIELYVRQLEPMEPYRVPLEALGYFFQFDPEMPDLHYFGYPVERPRRYHLHISQDGSRHLLRVVALRDYLRAHPAEAAAYAAVKADMTAQHGGDGPAYYAGKYDFVKALEARALAWAGI